MSQRRPTVYVFVRTDLPIPAQAVQACHACHESGREFGAPQGTHLILLGVCNSTELCRIMGMCKAHGIRYVDFVEPDWEWGLTAIATEPISGSMGRKLFSEYELWQLHEAA